MIYKKITPFATIVVILTMIMTSFAYADADISKNLKSINDMTLEEFAEALIPISIEELPAGMIPVEYNSLEEAYNGIKEQDVEFKHQLQQSIQAQLNDSLTTNSVASAAGQATNSYGMLNVTLYADASLYGTTARFDSIRSLNSYIDWYLFGTGWEQTDWDYYLYDTRVICEGTVYGIKYHYILIDTGIQILPSSEQCDWIFYASQFV